MLRLNFHATIFETNIFLRPAGCLLRNPTVNRQTHIHFNQLKVNLEGYLRSDESIKSAKSSDFIGSPRVKPQSSVV